MGACTGVGSVRIPMLAAYDDIDVDIVIYVVLAAVVVVVGCVVMLG